jgi:2-iminobutanoate/2-iminopropanoate deaminase
MYPQIDRYPSSLPLPFSKVVKAGGFLFLSGQIAMDAEGRFTGGDIAAQTEVVLRNIEATLAEHFATLAHVVKATVWLADLADFAAFNKVYAAHFGQGYPARSTVQSALGYGAAIEIEVQAYVGAGLGAVSADG